ncbi:hypothetical protein SAMN05421741_10797 [Paenimyroides ummariense]|uniref:Lipocalin-like domain-containing protein n=1 Tax=Paenimyroides ummariense TaxID=913024 RepID=A0A1I5A564_9FLAO|nr:lipocalin family protein [Paenimyroides ummariense]SFN57359.1 hypothetical protein SAMN05421741_10797 [Paenimyroides ummariense]
MKKLVALSALLSLTLVSCIVDDRPAGDQSGSQDKTETLLLGKWNMVKRENYQNGNLVLEEDLKPFSCDYHYYDLKTDGIKDDVYHDLQNCSLIIYSGTWSYNPISKQITLYDNNTEDGTTIAEVKSLTKTDSKLKIISYLGKPTPNGTEVYLYLEKQTK